CGPNCLGLVNVHKRVSLYSSGIPEGMREGGLAVVSHSGSACIALSTLGRFGLSYLVSVGNAAVLDVADYLEHLADDSGTKVVADLAERADVRLPDLAPQTVARLRAVLPAFASIGNPLDTTDRGVYDAQNVYSGSIRALADDPSVSLIAVVQDCSPGLSARGANNYRRIAQTVADAARDIAKPVVFFNTAAGGLHAQVIEPFAGSGVAVMQ